MRILYYDCFAGISGDMNLGALIDLGVDKNHLISELEKLNIEGFHLEIKQDQRRGITGTKADVIIENQENEKHRHLRHIEELINASTLSENIKKTSLKIFDLIAIAEAKVHNISKERVHFHEVGALDSIADIVGAAICLDYLQVDKVMSSSIQLGGGTVKCAHGVMPVPAPATALIVENIPVKTGLVNHEATTPTGAAILAATVDEFTDKLDIPISKTAYGIGNRDAEVANVLRVFLCDDKSHENVITEKAVVLESNIDDMNPEHFGFVMDKLFAAGASDVWMTPIVMKKSRPATTLSVLCKTTIAENLKEIIFENTTSLGVREYAVTKNMLQRESVSVETEFGTVEVKKSYFKGKMVRSKAEFENLKKLALQNNLPISEIENAVAKKINQ